MNSPITLYSSHSSLGHTASLTNLGCLPRPVSWEGAQEGAPHPHFRSEPVSIEIVKVSSSPVLTFLLDPCFRMSWGIFPGRFKGAGVTSKHS